MKKKHNYRERVCIQCGLVYKPTTSRQKCCSDVCYNKIANQKNKEYKKEWASKNKDKVTLSKQLWLQNNPEKRKESSSEYMRRNRKYYSMYVRMRSRRVKLATPCWVNFEDIVDIYKEAEYFQLEVDHIIPIKHKLVCGLHVPSNLQLLSRSDNAKKSNKFEPFDEDILGVLEDE